MSFNEALTNLGESKDRDIRSTLKLLFTDKKRHGFDQKYKRIYTLGAAGATAAGLGALYYGARTKKDKQ